MLACLAPKLPLKHHKLHSPIIIPPVRIRYWWGDRLTGTATKNASRVCANRGKKYQRVAFQIELLAQRYMHFNVNSVPRTVFKRLKYPQEFQ